MPDAAAEDASGCQDQDDLVKSTGFETCKNAKKVYEKTTEGSNLCKDPVFGTFFKEACPRTCEACFDNVCDFDRHDCFDDDKLLQQQTSGSRTDKGKYQTCREIADDRPEFCVEFRRATAGFDSYFAACDRFAKTNTVDVVSQSFAKSCQQSCGPSPECRRRLESVVAAAPQRTPPPPVRRECT